MIWDDGFADMTEGQARTIRAWRSEGHATWRSVAGRAADTWAGEWGTNQLAGIELCGRAALILGEDPYQEPWN